MLKKVSVSTTNEAQEEKDKSSLLMWSFIMMTVVGLGNRIFGKLQTIPMYDYPFFNSLVSVSEFLCCLFCIPSTNAHSRGRSLFMCPSVFST